MTSLFCGADLHWVKFSLKGILIFFGQIQPFSSMKVRRNAPEQCEAESLTTSLRSHNRKGESLNLNLGCGTQPSNLHELIGVLGFSWRHYEVAAMLLFALGTTSVYFTHLRICFGSKLK